MTDDFRAEKMVYMMKKIGLELAARMECRLKCKDISGVQVYFLVYILRHHAEGTYLTEMCHETGMSKATLSALIKKLREKEYLYFKENPDDIRKKKVLPTEKLLEEADIFLEKASQMEEEICSVLNSWEKAQLWNLEQKILAQLAVMEQKEKKTDRRFLYCEKSIAAAETI